MFNLTYNNHTPQDFDAWLATIPVLTHSKHLRTRQSVPGRDGELLGLDLSLSDAYWTAMFHLRQSDYAAKMRDIRQWLQGGGQLIISNSSDSFYEVEAVTFTADAMKSEDYGRITAQFEVYPFEFLTSGNTGISAGTITNPGDNCKPLYTITGTGSGTLSVNGNNMAVTCDGELNIDTRRQIAYDGQGVNASPDISGYYDELYLNTGNNTVSITGGLSVTTYPKWGYKI